MAIFHSYVSLPEGIFLEPFRTIRFVFNAAAVQATSLGHFGICVLAVQLITIILVAGMYPVEPAVAKNGNNI